ncbi:hypothetical protein RG48_10200 [Escherichia coli]|nr:hypothetical protein RG47_20380 [Escherichia coli]APK66414.1 hypothetical protein RG48_10200 [Escherichia coli]
MMSLWDALRMNMMISYQELVRTFPSPANSSEQYVVSLATGDQSVFEKLGFAYATCYKNL